MLEYVKAFARDELDLALVDFNILVTRFRTMIKAYKVIFIFFLKIKTHTFSLNIYLNARYSAYKY